MAKKILIKKMKILNFKGIKELQVDFGGNNFAVFGANGVGKTTLVDAFCWCLWGKDSRNQADFDIKPIVDGKPMSKAEHIVELVLQNGDNEISFERTFLEKWTKPRGALAFEFKGHESKYKVNAEPVTLRQYNDVVATLIDNKIFALLSNPLYFNENLKWEERRELLMKLAGEFSVADIIAGNENISDLACMSEAEIMVNKKIADSQASKIRKEIADIPARISELQRMLNADAISSTECRTAYDTLKTLQEDIMTLIKQRVFVNGQKFNETEELYEMQNELYRKKGEHKFEVMQSTSALKDIMTKCLNDITTNKNHIFEITNTKHDLNLALSQARNKRQILLDSYNSTNEKQYPKAEITDTCVVCHQPLPKEEVESAYAAYEQKRKEFNLAKSNKLSEILEEGQKTKKEIEALEQAIAKADEELKWFNTANQEHQATYDSTKQKLDDMVANAKEPVAIQQLEAKIVQLQQDNSEAKRLFEEKAEQTKRKISEEIEAKEQKTKELLAAIAMHEQNIKCQNRILELEEEERALNTVHEQHRIMSWKCEQFVLAKVNYVNKLIMDKFKIAKFVLFRKNISNDGVEQCCETVVNDVPYKSINDAARINVGMDIISTLIDFYGVAVPIFVDNAESVTDLNTINNKTQIIRLVVSKPDTQLRFEKE